MCDVIPRVTLLTGGAIYISIPGQDGGDCWNYLGFVSNEKPSGTFKIDNLKRMARDNMQNSFGNFAGPQIGVSVKSLNEISNLTPGKGALRLTSAYSSFSCFPGR